MGNQWLLFALLTVVSWGVYGILLHKGQVAMGDPANGRYKAFLFVGIAYFVVAIIGPALVMKSNGASWQFTPRGMNWSFWAGVVGAIGAFGTLLALGAAFGAKVTNPPAVVMSIVFAGAPLVNALVSIAMDRFEGKKYALPVPFLLGIALAAVGGFMVVKFKPVAPAPPKAGAAAPQVAPGYADVTQRSYTIN
jgi:hypothetical protein